MLIAVNGLKCLITANALQHLSKARFNASLSRVRMRFNASLSIVRFNALSKILSTTPDQHQANQKPTVNAESLQFAR